MDADFGYTGMYVERAANLDLTWYRAYDTEKGRWLSRDPLEELTGPNLYDYVNGNPIRWVDPLGLLTISVGGGYEGVVGGSGGTYSSGGYWSPGNGSGSYTTSGGGNGLGGGAGVNVGFYGGGPNQFMGPFNNWTLQTPWVSVSLFFNSCGGLQGVGVGFGPGIGFTSTNTNTVPGAQAPPPPPSPAPGWPGHR